MLGALNIKWPKNLATQRNKRERLLRRGEDPKLARAYELQTGFACQSCATMDGTEI